jgi:hypothetical protein
MLVLRHRKPPPARLRMSQIFVSQFRRRRNWRLAEDKGWDDVFLDFNPTQGIHPGDHEERGAGRALLFACDSAFRETMDMGSESFRN